MSDDMKERNFEEDIERWLLTKGGYRKGDPRAFDRQLALDAGTLLSFIKTSQPRLWARHQRNYPANPDKVFLDAFCENVRRNGLLHVLRNSVPIDGVKFHVVFWKPETALNPDALALYEKNVLHCTRQLHYSPLNENSIDITLFLNGIPVVCLELKNQLTGQDTGDAVSQFRHDRSPDAPIFKFKERVLVCFAVDTCDVRMTTRLRGAKTFFLPFNQGSNGAGRVGGSGNPTPESGYPVAHLWENVLAGDSLLELLHNYLHLERKEEKKASGKAGRKEKLIFPRYHQWDAVRKLLAHVKANGAGHNYLIQHSAGSGKSNSIAWLAHRLSGLHDAGDSKIFQGVVIVTDRRVLDSQLQDTVYQFDHQKGLVVCIDENSAQLRDALNEGAGIIITTIWKFPVIYAEVRHTGRNYAVIVDEAHSSQTGEAADKLKKALGDSRAALEEFARLEYEEEERLSILEDERWREMASHGRHENLSFFAFTATPKDRTLQIFGERREDGSYAPFHVYSMRQAIEEGFILDVLGNYVTYGMYYRLIKKIEDDPEYNKTVARSAAIRFETLHPHTISQKVAVMLDHFTHLTVNKIGGRAKAMVVTASRKHAVLYMLEFARQIGKKGLKNVRPLVAFSGAVAVTDPETNADAEYTESALNGKVHGRSIQENQVPSLFSGEFNVLIVAEKYQTGFDEPLLHTMFVDKKLAGVRAVQTLSRLNRIAPDKDSTFVLDFVNTAEEIKEAFDPYYARTFLQEGTDPNVIYQIRTNLEDCRIFTANDFGKFKNVLAGKGKVESRLAAAVNALQPVVRAYCAREERERSAFRTGLARFNRIYNFVTQISRMFDEDMYLFSIFSKKLSSMLPPEAAGRVDLDDKIDLEYFRLQKTGEGAIRLEGSEEGFRPMSGDAGAGSEKEEEALSEVIKGINERFRTEFDPRDKVKPLMQIRDTFRRDSRFVTLAREGDMKNLEMLYEAEFENKVVEVCESNKDFFDRIAADGSLLNAFKEGLWRFVVNSLTRDAA